MKSLTIFLIVLLCLQNGLARRVRTEKDITDQMIKYAEKTQSKSDVAEYKQILAFLTFSNYIYRAALSSYSDRRASVLCLTCRSAVAMVIAMYKSGSSTGEINTYLTNLCISLHIQTPNVCKGTVASNAPIFEYILENQPLFNQRAFCGVLLQSNNKNACPYSDERYEWTIDIPGNAEITTKDLPLDDDNNRSFKIAHLTDIHYDPVYEPGGLANCNDPTCCRKGQTEKASRHWKSLEDDSEEENQVHFDEDGLMFIDLDQRRNNKVAQRTPREEENESKDEPAGYWGDYRNCDTPWWSFVDGIEQVNKNKDVDIIYYTGDTVDHGLWETSKPLITSSLNDTLNKFKEVFGNRPVFPGAGNHESQPLNQYAPPSVTDPEVSTSWLYELLVDKWSMWLPSDTKETILIGGYYTTLVKPGLRVVVLNSNLCYIFNWWIHLDPNDPSDQLKWLTKTLYDAEKAGERVHILSHIPPGVEDQYYTCAREYVKIIRRFSNIIVGELNGHTHNDEFKIYYKSNMHDPLLMAWNSGSLTPYSFVNPNYRIFEVDGKTFDFIDFDTYIYNLTEANLTPDKPPRWFKSYSFKEHYGVKSLAASEIDKLIHRMVTTDRKLLIEDYHVFRGKNSDSFVNEKCDNKCVKTNICYMVNMDLYDTSKCDYLFRKFNETNPQ